MEHGAPPMGGVLETVLYFSEERSTIAFYGGILGFRLVGREPGRSLFYRAGSSVFLLFDARSTREPGRLPAHGADGAIHTCFQVSPGDYEAWKTHLERSAVKLLAEIEWSRGRSFYFHDPHGNLLEIANADIWPRS